MQSAFGKSTRRFFGSRCLALHSIENVLDPADIVRIAVAYFEPSGFEALQHVLVGKQVFLLVGREEGGRDRVQDVIDDFVQRLSAHPLRRRIQAMCFLLEALENNMLFVGVDASDEQGVFVDPRYLYHHAKLYIADDGACVVTSANMSHHGLVVSREAGYVVEESEAVAYYIEQFENYFEQAQPITSTLIEKLRAFLQAHPPYYVYVRALTELYGLHIVAYLRMRQRVSRVIIICPAGLRETWRRFMRAAVTSSVEFSYHTMSADDPARNSNVRNLDYELRHLTDDTLIIIDESHHIRNPDNTGGERKLRYVRVEDAIHREGVQVLMLTATPFSCGIQDVNAQLKLLPKSQLAGTNQLFDDPTYWNVDSTERLPNLPPCAVLTTPSVVHHFSHQDNEGHQYVVFSESDRRYFPSRLRFQTQTYDVSVQGVQDHHHKFSSIQPPVRMAKC